MTGVLTRDTRRRDREKRRRSHGDGGKAEKRYSVRSPQAHVPELPMTSKVSSVSMTISVFHWYRDRDPHDFQQKARGTNSADEWTSRARSAVRSQGGPRTDAGVFSGSFHFFLCTSCVLGSRRPPHLPNINSGSLSCLRWVEGTAESGHL